MKTEAGKALVKENSRIMNNLTYDLRECLNRVVDMRDLDSYDLDIVKRNLKEAKKIRKKIDKLQEEINTMVFLEGLE